MEAAPNVVDVVAKSSSACAGEVGVKDVPHVTNVLTANAFGIDIFTHTGGKWLKYSTMSTKLSNEAIYLHFSDNSHCEPVVCVQPINKKSCYGVCKPDSLSDTQYMSRRKSKHTCIVLNVMDTAKEQAQCVANNDVSKSTYSYSKYLKKKKNIQMKMLYEKNYIYQQNIKNASRKKYSDVNYQQAVKLAGKIRYCKDEDYKCMPIGYTLVKYHGNTWYKQKLHSCSQQKYRNVSHRNTVKEMGKTKYHQNHLHCHYVKAISKKKYHDNPDHKARVVITSNKLETKQERKQ